MFLTQNWVGYLDRSYEQIKKSLLFRLGINTPEITDYSESNILIVILSMFSGIGEMLNLYIDTMARETYIGTAQKYASVVRLAYLMDYQVKPNHPSSVELTFTLSGVHTSDIIIPAGTIVSNGLGVYFTLPYPITVFAGNLRGKGNAAQYLDSVSSNIGTSDGTPLQQYLLPTTYAHRSLLIIIDGDLWQEYTSLGLMKPDTKGFIVSVLEDGNAYLKFGDGVNGAIPPNGEVITESHKDTLGATGNLPPNSITTIDSTLSLPGGLTVSVNNENYASAGEDFESLEDIKNRAPRMLRTLETAKTYQDYLDLPLLVPGVKDDSLTYCCGKFINIYIAPKGRGVANQLLLDEVANYMNPRKMITTFLAFYPAGVSKVWIKGKVYGKPSIKTLDLNLQVLGALDSAYGYDVAKINLKIVVSEIIALVENLTFVERFELEQIKILPYVRPINGTTSTLDLTFDIIPIGTASAKYTIQWNDTNTQFDVFLGGLFQAAINPGDSYADSAVTITFPIVSPGQYVDGDIWEFSTSPSYPEIFPTTVIQIDDESQGVVEVSEFIDSLTARTIYGDIEFIETFINPLDQPPCK